MDCENSWIMLLLHFFLPFKVLPFKILLLRISKTISSLLLKPPFDLFCPFSMTERATKNYLSQRVSAWWKQGEGSNFYQCWTTVFLNQSTPDLGRKLCRGKLSWLWLDLLVRSSFTALVMPLNNSTLSKVENNNFLNGKQ